MTTKALAGYPMISSSEDLPSHRATWETGGKKTFHYGTRQCASLPQIMTNEGLMLSRHAQTRKTTDHSPNSIPTMECEYPKGITHSFSLVIVTNPVVKN